MLGAPSSQVLFKLIGNRRKLEIKIAVLRLTFDKESAAFFTAVESYLRALPALCHRRGDELADNVDAEATACDSMAEAYYPGHGGHDQVLEPGENRGQVPVKRRERLQGENSKRQDTPEANEEEEMLDLKARHKLFGLLVEGYRATVVGVRSHDDAQLIVVCEFASVGE